MYVEIVKIVCIYLLIRHASSSLLSRIRNRHEYIPDADLEVIRSLDDKTYQDLMQEIPILQQVFKGSSRDSNIAPHTQAADVVTRYLAAPTAASDDMSISAATIPLTSEHSSSYTNARPTRPRTHWPGIDYRMRRKNLEEEEQQQQGEYELRAVDKYPHVFSCYWCGLNDSLLPNSTICYDAFQSPRYGLYGLSRYFRAHCHFNDTRHSTQHRINRTYPHFFEYANDPGLKLMVVGPFMRGCFKRFVDVGTLYTARGCRGLYHPWRSYTRSFASHRLAKLEILTRGFDDRCVSSPEASLTPFSRDISLFVRYHVCVCTKPYCNLAALRHVDQNVCSDQQPRMRHRQDPGPGSRSDLQIIKNLDEQTFHELMNELPVLKKVLKGNRNDGSLQFNSSALPMLFRGEIIERPNGPPIMAHYDVSSHSPATPRASYRDSARDRVKSYTYRTRWPTAQERTRRLLDGRRLYGPWANMLPRWRDFTFTARWYNVYPHITSCYWCGLNDSLIPNNSLCYSIWDAEDTRMRDIGRFFRARCHYYDRYRYYDRQIRLPRSYPATIEYWYDVGLKTCMFGPYMKGCFKRFVDVGPLYTSRGCRGAWQPWRAYSRSFAAHRLMKLEIVARGHEDVCVHSPEAALTPYSRAISLFVRYHVCVCLKPYCNAAMPLAAPLAALFAVLFAVLFAAPYAQSLWTDR